MQKLPSMPTINDIFVALSTFAEHGDEPLRLLQESGLRFTLNPLKRRLNVEEIPQVASDVRGIIAGVEIYDTWVLKQLPQLKCISRCGVGIDNIDLNYCAEHGIVVRNTPDVVIQPVAEMTIAMIFDLLRRLSLHTQILKSGGWEKKTGNLLQGKIVGVVGLGRIGEKVAEILVLLGAKVIGHDITFDRGWQEKWNVQAVLLDELLHHSDIVTLHTSHRPESPFYLGEREITLMKKGAFLINVARGNIVDEDIVYNALRADHLGGAAFDVFPTEPYMGKLRNLKNIVLTPHVSTLTQESRLQMEIEATQNLLEVLVHQSI